ncbi:MAG TPA: protein kinase [Gemmata sp.]|nr:protein kinase [Gemmata sp.]
MSEAIRLGMTAEVSIPPAQSLLSWLLDTRILLTDEWEELGSADRDQIAQSSMKDDLLNALVRKHLLTTFQVEMIRKGDGEDLVFGHYRILDFLGRGGMGTVYRGEHQHLRRAVAIKVMTRVADMSPRVVHRFYAEAQAVAKLQHPNIVTCFDAGRHYRDGSSLPRDYFVMELIPGQDLYTLIREKGPLPAHRSCDIFRQVADALAEAHRHGLIHRDIKPSNILITPDWQAKVLDFGLARVPTRNVTEPGTVLGTIGYMAPEQARDPHAVDSRADLFSLGATLYWALTGSEPYPETGNTLQDLHRRLTTTPPPVRQLRPEIPAAVSDLVARLMETDPDRRLPSARAAAAALTGFGLLLPLSSNQDSGSERKARVLVIDDEPLIRGMMTAVLRDRYEVREVGDAEAALAEITRHPPDLAIIDVNLPGMSGQELIARVRSLGLGPDRLSVLLTSGMLPEEALGGLALSGADDFLSKPFKPTALMLRVRTLLQRRASSGSAEGGTVGSGPTVRIPVAAMTRAAPSSPPVRPTAAAEALSLTVMNLLAEANLSTQGQAVRIGKYIRALASAVSDSGEYSRLKDEALVDMLAAVAPLHDIGVLALPRSVLMKPGKLEADEMFVVQTHTSVGSEVLHSVAATMMAEVPCLPLAVEIARSHHERWDGSGYPAGLAGTEIPLVARVVSLVTVYEALRSRRPHRPPIPHARAVKIIATESPGQFDPALVAAFRTVAPRFEQICQIG